MHSPMRRGAKLLHFNHSMQTVIALLSARIVQYGLSKDLVQVIHHSHEYVNGTANTGWSRFLSAGFAFS